MDSDFLEGSYGDTCVTLAQYNSDPAMAVDTDSYGTPATDTYVAPDTNYAAPDTNYVAPDTLCST